MDLSAKAQEIVSDLALRNANLGEIKKRGKELGKDHELGLELWSSNDHRSRLLAILIFDAKLLDQQTIVRLAGELEEIEESERHQLSDWFLANQLMKDKKLIALLESWESHTSPILRRWFWYHQARLRWTGQVPPDNSEQLLDSLERDMQHAEPGVQWAMNFCACQIGVHEPRFRSRCVQLGERVGLYKDDPVARNCTPSYLPEFIRIEVAKRA